MSSFLDRLFVYHPAPWIERDWARISRLPLEEVWFDAADGPRLFGWYVEAPGARATLLWCHGNAGNIIHRLDNLALLYQAGLSVLLFDYRGYGRSGGMPSEEGLYRDAEAAARYLEQVRQVAPSRLVLFGRSLGAAVAGDLAVRRRSAGLILESAFPSVASVAKTHYYGLPVHLLLEARFDLISRLRAVTVPILVVHGDRDDLIPPDLGQQVFAAAPEPKAWYLVRGAGHNDLYQVGGAAYFQRLTRFVEEVAR
ncbi:alpha/beta hydrolase [Nitrospira sp. Kam-Ns4a]